MMRRILPVLAMFVLAASPMHAQHLIVPMDQAQINHLKAYGLTYWVLEQGLTAEWLLNYRAGSFLLPDRADIRREAALRGVTAEPASGGRSHRSARRSRARTWKRSCWRRRPTSPSTRRPTRPRGTTRSPSR